MTRAPAVFISHGSPMAAVQEDDYTRALVRFAHETARPQAIVVMSAHWEKHTPPIEITAVAQNETMHDFGGFPEELYQLKYPAPGDVALADRISKLLSAQQFENQLNSKRGLDHGVWTPLLHAYPEANIPVLQISLPMFEDPRELMRVGRALAPLRDEGVLLVGSGGAVHNLGKLKWNEKNGQPDSWALEYRDWVRGNLLGAKIDDLIAFETKGPQTALAHPTTEHFVPIFFTIGASLAGDKPRVFHDSFQYGNLSMLSFLLG